MSGFVEALGRVPALAAQHLLLSAAALLLGLVVALPLAVWSARHEGVRWAALGFASVAQTIPGLALLALFYPVLLFLSGLMGGGIPALGFLPALLALALYALLPILRTAVTGLVGIDPAIVEAADGIGMTAWQKLRLVEAPLALPVVMAGVRTAAVWTIGAATLATTVGQPSLGDLIFAGLQTQAWALVLAGCVAAAALALGADLVLGLAESGLRARRRGRVWTAAGLSLVALGAAAATLRPTGHDVVTIGGMNFSEQFILERVIAHRLEAAGYTVRLKDGLGSAVNFGAVASGDSDVAVGYAGTVWTNQMGGGKAPSRLELVRKVGAWMARTHRMRLLGTLGFENAYAFAMKGADARPRGIASLDDLARASPGLRLGSDLEFLDRPEWRAVRAAYPMRFADARAYNPTFMYRALASGEADVITAFSSDGRIAADRLTVLSDPRGAIPSYDAIVMLSPERAGDARFVAALAPLVGRIPVEAMREANYLVDRDADKKTPDEAARWLERTVGL